MKVTELQISDRSDAVELLMDFDLAYTDLDQPNVRLFRFEDDGQLVGFGGLEIYDDRALLRSIAVRKEFQGKRAGRFICNWIENWATENRISELYLLTTTASDFFAHLNYKVIGRNECPETIKQTAQFSQLCPSSSTCMKKAL